MDNKEKDSIRLSDRVLSALELSLSQHDLEMSEHLAKALDMAMTRRSGGGDFVERRDYPPEMEEAMEKLHALRESTESTAANN